MRIYRISTNSESIQCSLDRKSINPLTATITLGNDSIKVIGCHFASNSNDGENVVSDISSLLRVKCIYQDYKCQQAKRLVQVSKIRHIILGATLPVIVLGDMNDFNCSEPMNSLTRLGLIDAWWHGGMGYGTTFHEGWMKLRIDHILFNDRLKLTGVRVVRTNLSDHNPIIADFKVKTTH